MLVGFTVAAGDSATFTHTLGPSLLGPCFDGECKVRVTADADDEVQEIDETNNEDLQTF